MSVETPEFLAMLSRQIKAAGRRVAEADEPELAQLATLVDELDQAMRTAITGQRASGRSWTDIGRALGITKQTAHERYRTAALAAEEGMKR